MMKIAYLGPSASFTYLATQLAFPNAELVPYLTIPACIQAAEERNVDVAVVPIENTIEGPVNVTLDYLYHQSNLSIQAELVLPIHQHLMVHPRHVSEWKNATKVLSHPQALAQSQHFLTTEISKAVVESTPSTAYAAEFVSQHPEQNLVAVASKVSADEYQLTIVAENIQELENNQTRFVLLSHQNVELPRISHKEKISMSVTVPDNVPGALHKVLSTFSWRQIDLCKIESRPLKTVLGEYFFLIDLYVNNQQTLIQHAIEEIELLGGIVKVFGCYTVYPIQ